MFSFDTKSATVSSIITILFTQVAKLSTIILKTGLRGFDLSMLPVMIAGAVGGGYIGSGNEPPRSKTARYRGGLRDTRSKQRGIKPVFDK